MRNRAAGLTTGQVDSFRRDGYLLHPEPVLPEQKFDRLVQVFEENLERNGPDDLDRIHFRDPRLLEFLLSDEVVDLVEPLIGPDIGLWSSHFICKPPRVGKATPWHEDSSYWDGLASTMEGICTIWLALDRVTTENGCMRVIPGSHVNGFSEYRPVDMDQNIFSSAITEEQVDEAKAVDFVLEPNQCSIHEARIIHGALANTSADRRAGYTMRYFPTTTLIHAERLPGGHKIWLARGRDHAGNTFENA